MKFMKNAVPRAFVFALVGLTTGMPGCGGGGGSSSASAEPVAISQTNMTDVASTALLAGNASGTASFGGNLVTGVVGNQALPAPTPRLTELAITQAKRLLYNQSVTQNSVTGVQGSDSEQCPISGTVTVSYNVQQTGTPSAGDTMSVSFSNCLIDADYSINGRMAITINSFSGNFQPVGSMSIAVQLTNLRMVYSGASFNANGNITVSVNADSAGSDSTLHSDSYSYGVTFGGRSASIAITNYDMHSVEVIAQNTITWTESGHFSATFPTFSGSGDISTLVPLVKDRSGYNGITAGKLRVVGASSTLDMTFQPGNLVLLELDGNNDGTIDHAATKSVFDLNPFTELF